jgi:hypothetical protein
MMDLDDGQQMSAMLGINFDGVLYKDQRHKHRSVTRMHRDS